MIGYVNIFFKLIVLFLLNKYSLKVVLFPFEFILESSISILNSVELIILGYKVGGIISEPRWEPKSIPAIPASPLNP